MNNNCMEKMADGRAFTNYKSDCIVTSMIMRQNNVTNSYDLKQLLIHNAVDLMKLSQNFYLNKSCLNKCSNTWITPDPNGNDRHNDLYKKSLYNSFKK